MGGCQSLAGRQDQSSLPPSLVKVLAQKAESDTQEALEKEADYANNNSVNEEDGEYEHDHAEEEIEEEIEDEEETEDEDEDEDDF